MEWINDSNKLEDNYEDEEVFHMDKGKYGASVVNSPYAITWAVMCFAPYKVLEYQFSESVTEAKEAAEKFLEKL